MSTTHLRRAEQISALPVQGHWALMNKHKRSEASEMGRNAGSIIETVEGGWLTSLDIDIDIAFCLEQTPIEFVPPGFFSQSAWSQNDWTLCKKQISDI